VKKVAKNVFKTYDTDEDNLVNFETFKQCVAFLIPLITEKDITLTDEELREDFDIYDEDQDGKISLQGRKYILTFKYIFIYYCR
jgi:Ca2+-binding EF-hand superfamily protein